MTTQQTDDEVDEIEGLDDKFDDSLGDYPIDTVLIRNETRTVHEILRRIGQGKYVMNPDFQRDFIWTDDKQSKLIESVLMRIPLPVFYLAEDYEGQMIVVDGLQRLFTFQRFVDNKLRLKLPDNAALNGQRFRDLSPKLQNRVEDCNLILYVIDAKVAERARLDIFDRVNSGVPLTKQQMRNSLYMGAATKFLKEEATSEIFLKSTGKSLRTTTMRDREFVNRFCAFQILQFTDYKGDMDDYLAEALRKMNDLKAEDLKGLSAQLRLSLANNLNLFGEHAFRKHDMYQDRRNVINASLWDVMSTEFSKRTEKAVIPRSKALRAAFHELMADDKFINSITYATNGAKSVRHRFNTAAAVFQRVFDD